MLLCSAERGHVPQQYLLGPPFGNYHLSCASNKQVGRLLGEGKKKQGACKEKKPACGGFGPALEGQMVCSGSE